MSFQMLLLFLWIMCFLMNIDASISISQQLWGCQATKEAQKPQFKHHKSNKYYLCAISKCILQYFFSLTALVHFELLLYGKDLCEDYFSRQMCPLMAFVLSSA